MSHWIVLVPVFPLLGSAFLGLCGRWLSPRATGWIATAAVALSFGVSFALWRGLTVSAAPDHAYQQTLWTWLEVGGFRSEFRLRLDALSLVMILVVSFVSFLIHLYSIPFMRPAGARESMQPGESREYCRFFAFMNLFVASMLTLVLADDLLLLYLGWEGVGLCSYLLIGFWFRDPANGLAARKAFLVTRVGDTSLALGLFVLFTSLGTLEIQPMLGRAVAEWPTGSMLPIVASALLLGGAVGKSAQLPLQTWLPDAMAGPTPVSALIHAATMVTAGVYLIARLHPLFDLAPEVREVVAVIGAATLLLSAFSALVQTDIKRVLAYSTISQIGYMFLALGVGAYSAAIFHFMTHAFFKALLFLAAGAVILSLEHEHDIRKMGGLRKSLPVVFWTFLIGAASLSAVPWITAGFYSKDLILTRAGIASQGFPWFLLAGLLGAFLTSLYSFRLCFLVFFGKTRTRIHEKPGLLMILPLVVLAAFSLFGGWVDVPGFLSSFFDGSQVAEVGRSTWVPLASGALSILGIGLAYFFYASPAGIPSALLKNPPVRWVRAYWFSGWGFDRLYDLFLVRPFHWLSSWNQADGIDLVFQGIGWINLFAYRMLSRTESGQVRWYATVIAAGAAVILALAETL